MAGVALQSSPMSLTGEDLPIFAWLQHSDFTFVTDCVDLAIGCHRRREVVSQCALESPLLQHGPCACVKGSQDSALFHQVEHILI